MRKMMFGVAFIAGALAGCRTNNDRPTFTPQQLSQLNIKTPRATVDVNNQSGVNVQAPGVALSASGAGTMTPPKVAGTPQGGMPQQPVQQAAYQPNYAGAAGYRALPNSGSSMPPAGTSTSQYQNGVSTGR